jgi:hypothetical protein
MKNTNTGSKDTRSGFGAGMTELGQRMKMWWHFVLI